MSLLEVYHTDSTVPSGRISFLDHTSHFVAGLFPLALRGGELIVYVYPEYSLSTCQ